MSVINGFVNNIIALNLTYQEVMNSYQPSYQLYDRELKAIDTEMNFDAGKLKSIDAVGILLVVGAGILTQHLTEGREAGGAYLI